MTSQEERSGRESFRHRGISCGFALQALCVLSALASFSRPLPGETETASSCGRIASSQRLHLCCRQGSKRISHSELPHDSVLLVTPDGNGVHAPLPAVSLPALEGGDRSALHPDRRGTS